MNRIALIRNPKSHGNRNFRPILKEVRGARALAGFAEPEDQAALLNALRYFKRQDTDIIAINGGDGTVREVLTALRRIDAEWRPALALIPAGKTNLIAHDVGGAGLQQILRAAQEGSLLTRNRIRRRILEISRNGQDEAPVCGLFFGAGAFSAGTELAAAKANALGLFHGPAVAWTITAMLLRSLRGQAYGPAGSDMMRLQADGDTGRKGRYFIILATTCQRLILGLNPFWGNQDRPIRYTDIAGPPARLAAGIIPVLRGRPRPWMPAAGYHSASADCLRLSLTSLFTVDGELFDPGPEAQIEISAPRSVDFVSP